MFKKRNLTLLTLALSLNLSSTLISCTNQAQENAYFKNTPTSFIPTAEYLEKHYFQYKNLQQLLIEFVENIKGFLKIAKIGVFNITQNKNKIWTDDKLVEFFGGKNSVIIKNLLEDFKKHYFRWSNSKIDNSDQSKLSPDETKTEVFESFSKMIQLLGELNTELPNLKSFSQISLKLEANIKRIESFLYKESQEFLEIFQFLDIIAKSDVDYKAASPSLSDPLSNQNLEKFRLLERQIPKLKNWREELFGAQNSNDEKNQFKTFWSIILEDNEELVIEFLKQQKPTIFLNFLIFLLSFKLQAIKDSLTQLKIWLLAQKEFFNPISTDSLKLYQEISQKLPPITPKIHSKILQANEINQKLLKLRREMIGLTNPLQQLKNLVTTKNPNFEKLEISLDQEGKQNINLKEFIKKFGLVAEEFLKNSLEEKELNIFTIFNEYTYLIQSYRESFNNLTKAQTNFLFLKNVAKKMFWYSKTIEELMFKSSLNLTNFLRWANFLKNSIAKTENFDKKNEFLNLFNDLTNQFTKMNTDLVATFLTKLDNSDNKDALPTDPNLLFQKLVEENKIADSIEKISKLTFKQLEIFKNLWDTKLLNYLFVK